MRRLNETDCRVIEVTHELFQKVALCLVVAINDADDLCLGRRVPESKIQSARLSAGPTLQVEEPEAVPEVATVLLYRSPEGGIGGVVIDHQHFKVVVPDP